MQVAADNLALVEGILDRLLAGDPQPLLQALADDVVLTVAAPDGDPPETALGTGRAAVLEYFQVLGDLVTFWRVRQTWGGSARVAVLAEERFVLQPVGVEAHSELALLFDLSEGVIARLTLVEDPRESPALSGYLQCTTTVPCMDGWM